MACDSVKQVSLIRYGDTPFEGPLGPKLMQTSVPCRIRKEHIS